MMIASLVASCTWLEAIKSLILSAQILLDYRLHTHFSQEINKMTPGKQT